MSEHKWVAMMAYPVTAEEAAQVHSTGHITLEPDRLTHGPIMCSECSLPFEDVAHRPCTGTGPRLVTPDDDGFPG